ncbi:MAG: tripartite tricarboxylate transporter TctB family protein [Deltaproteobacteria bacterium]|nr:tripartite tricarboxylate transporter TctB family protein [Deltaproteobacteria bacterium]
MKFRSQALFDLVILVFFIVFVYQAKDWRLQARLYPWAIGIPMLVLAVTLLVRELMGKDKKQEDGPGSTNAPVDFRFSHAGQTGARRRTLNIFGWIFGFFFGIWFVGFAIAVPVFVFLYLKVRGGEGWGISLGLTACAWFAFWGLFTWLLNLPFPDGQLMVWLGLV